MKASSDGKSGLTFLEFEEFYKIFVYFLAKCTRALYNLP